MDTNGLSIDTRADIECSYNSSLSVLQDPSAQKVDVLSIPKSTR